MIDAAELSRLIPGQPTTISQQGSPEASVWVSTGLAVAQTPVSLGLPYRLVKEV